MMVVETLGPSSTATMLSGQNRPLPGSVASYFESPSAGARYHSLTIAMPDIPLESRPRLVQDIERELNRLWVLPPHWDGRRAAQLQLTAAQGAVNTLAALMALDSPPPQFFPLPDGGVQVEWLVAGNSIEIEVEGDGSVQILAMNAAGEVVADGELADPESGAVIETTRRFLAELSAIWRSGAPHTA